MIKPECLFIGKSYYFPVQHGFCRFNLELVWYIMYDFVKQLRECSNESYTILSR